MKPLSVRRAALGMMTVGVISAGVAGVLMLGSPAEERGRRLDERRVADLVSLSRAADVYWTRHSDLPAAVAGLLNEPGAAVSASDPGTGAPYEYVRIDGATYELCATFHASATLQEQRSDADFWTHGEGRQCFRRDAHRVQ